MAAAVPLVCLLAWLDLRREQARALEDFTSEQAALAEAFAGALQPRVHGALAELTEPAALLRDLPVAPDRLVVIADPTGRARVLASGAPELDRQLDDVRALLERMQAGGAGALALGRPAAASLGLPLRLAVAGFAPIPGSRWSVAVVASARRVRDRARVSTWRLLAATTLTSALVGLFGFFVTRQQRRSLALAEALRLAEATAALRERSEKIVETIPLGVLALDGAERVSSVNPWLAERRVAPGQALAQALPRTRPEELAPLTALVAEARATRRPGHHAALTLRLASDEAREIDAYAIPLLHPLPDADCFVVLHDRTEMRQLERNLVRAEKLATIGTLAAGVAHEVGTPLGIISGRAEQLLSRFADNDPMKKHVTSILAQVDKVSSTIRQLLDFARTRPIEATAVTPTQALETARALLEHRFRQAKVELTVDAAPGVPAVAGDPGQLEQVFVNLLINAADACAAGGHVRASALASGERVRFEIADDGCGIAPDHLPSVTDPFFTTKKRGQGTGLGLTIAADIVKNHGGTLEIASTVGRGTTVRVELPIARMS
jgi:signal transduction histidine kinase